MTNNIKRRLEQHNKGRKAGGARYTSTRRPVKLFKVFKVSSKNQALKLERQIKKLPRREKLTYVHQQRH